MKILKQLDLIKIFKDDTLEKILRNDAIVTDIQTETTQDIITITIYYKYRKMQPIISAQVTTDSLWHKDLLIEYLERYLVKEK